MIDADDAHHDHGGAVRRAVTGCLLSRRTYLFAHGPNATFPPWPLTRRSGNDVPRLLARPDLQGDAFLPGLRRGSRRMALWRG